MTAEPVERLLSALRAVQQHAPAAVADWFEQGIGAFLAGDDGLERALGLRAGPGARTAVTRFQLATRDHHLCAAWRSLDESSPWRRSVLLEQRLRRFESRIWPRLKTVPEPPERLGTIDRALFRAFATGQTMPALRRLHEICATSSAYSLRLDPVMLSKTQEGKQCG